MWLLLGRTKLFATLPFDGSTGVRLERSMVQEIRRETVGTEIVDGTQLSTDRILFAIRLSRSSQIIFAQFIV